MIDVSLTIAFVAILVSMALTTWRLVQGPTAPDRIVALDTLSINAIALLAAIGIYLRTDLFFEAALLIAMMGFIGTVSLAKHAGGRSVIE